MQGDELPTKAMGSGLFCLSAGEHKPAEVQSWGFTPLEPHSDEVL